MATSPGGLQGLIRGKWLHCWLKGGPSQEKADPTGPEGGVEQGHLLLPSHPQVLVRQRPATNSNPIPSRKKELRDLRQTQTESLGREKKIPAKGFGITTVHSPRKVGFATALLKSCASCIKGSIIQSRQIPGNKPRQLCLCLYSG